MCTGETEIGGDHVDIDFVFWGLADLSFEVRPSIPALLSVHAEPPHEDLIPLLASWDYAAAFPSVIQKWTQKTIQLNGAPQGF